MSKIQIVILAVTTVILFITYTLLVVKLASTF